MHHLPVVLVSEGTQYDYNLVYKEWYWNHIQVCRGLMNTELELFLNAIKEKRNQEIAK
jgi:hypothetical protein